MLAAIEAALAPYEARPHWGKVFAMGPEQVRALYPRFDEFRELVRRARPEGRLPQRRSSTATSA